MKLPATTAPEINTEHGWLNTDKPYSIRDFRGKIVLLDFWTFGCINCHHIIPDLKKLEKEYPHELVVIGVHSAKFPFEKKKEAIEDALHKFGIDHPVVNDADFKVWEQYGIKAWPTIVLISPEGKVIGQKIGEGVYDQVKPFIDRALKYNTNIQRSTGHSNHKNNVKRLKNVHYPSKIIAEMPNNLWLSDTGNNRILKIDMRGHVKQIIGAGIEGFNDGSFSDATFHHPRGLALYKNNLYIADTNNHAIRMVDLKAGSVATVAGDGEMGYYFHDLEWKINVKPNSPWDLQTDNHFMYVASAGNHQILRMNLKTHKLYRFAGTGREELIDGSFRDSYFNQPSGLTKIDNILFVADAEASAIRALDLKEQTVKTIVGKGLFAFGDKDGKAEDALLQHCSGLSGHDQRIFIADSYNGKVKLLNLDTSTIETVATDLNEPGDVICIGNVVWIVDTNNHQLVRVDLSSLQRSEIQISIN